jgi:hypothetical protein
MIEGPGAARGNLPSTESAWLLYGHFWSSGDLRWFSSCGCKHRRPIFAFIPPVTSLGFSASSGSVGPYTGPRSTHYPGGHIIVLRFMHYFIIIIIMYIFLCTILDAESYMDI